MGAHSFPLLYLVCARKSLRLSWVMVLELRTRCLTIHPHWTSRMHHRNRMTLPIPSLYLFYFDRIIVSLFHHSCSVVQTWVTGNNYTLYALRCCMITSSYNILHAFSAPWCAPPRRLRYEPLPHQNLHTKCQDQEPELHVLTIASLYQNTSRCQTAFYRDP